MKRLSLDFGFLATLFLASFALLPLLRQHGLPQGYDVFYHTYRVAEMQRSWEAGILMPRWADSFYFGYGYPVFHYYASASYYLTSLMISLTGISAIGALRGLIVLSLLGGGTGMYAANRQRWGVWGAILAALVYVYSPYILYTEPYTRGDYPELLSFGLFPWLLYAFSAPNTRAQKLGACLGVTFLILTHNLMALVFFGLLCGWLVWSYFPQKQGFQYLLVAGLGVALAAYFWLPVLAERDAVQLDNLIEIAELDYRNFFVPANTLFSAPKRADAGALNGLLPRYQLGWGALVLGGLGCLSLLRFPGRRQTAYFGLMALVMIVLILPMSSPIWELVSPLAYLQFPWRFLGPVAACLAMLSAANGAWLDRLPRVWQMLAFSALVLFILVMAIPYFFVPQWSLKTVDTSVAAYQAAEVAGLQRGTTFSGEFLPKDVFVVPTPNERLLADFADGYPVDKIHRELLPQGVQANLLSHNPHRSEWRIQAEEAFSLEVLTFYFEGWQARVNGESVPIQPSVPHGLITFAVPAGDSRVEVFLGMTPARRLGYILSGLAGLGLIGLLYFSPNRSEPSPPKKANPLPLSIGLALIFSLILGLVFRAGIAWYDSPAGLADPAQHPVNFQFGDQLQLLGYDLSAERVRAGQAVELGLYWYALQTPQVGYASFVHVTTGGPPVAQSDRQNPGSIPTQKWTPDAYVYDLHRFYLPDWLPAGDYSLVIGLWTCEGLPEGQACGNGLRLEVRDAEGEYEGDSLALQILQVR